MVRGDTNHGDHGDTAPVRVFTNRLRPWRKECGMSGERLQKPNFAPMKFQLTIQDTPLPQPIRYSDKILLVGSCFTEHISGRLAAHKFRVLQNPHGILFNPFSVAKSLLSYISGKQYQSDELFNLNELWGSWDHHTRFSHINQEEAVSGINQSRNEAATFIREADWIIITLGSAFQYVLSDTAPAEIRDSVGKVSLPFGVNDSIKEIWNRAVANNHRAPAAWFEKRLLSIGEISEVLTGALRSIADLNPNAKFLFTISPVRHIRDGVVENNRSKARLIEVIHELCERTDCFYFPAYEWVIDVLRDYRFYDIDMVHPNYAATEAVWEAFVTQCLDFRDLPLLKDLHELVRAKNHHPRFPETEAHQKFLKNALQKAEALQAAHPFLDLGEELRYFKGI